MGRTIQYIRRGYYKNKVDRATIYNDTSYFLYYSLVLIFKEIVMKLHSYKK